MPSEEQAGAQTNFPTVGRWLVTALPRGWMYIAGFGIRQMQVDSQAAPANISLGQDQLSSPEGFGEYIANQSRLIQQFLVNPAIAGPQPTSFPGTAEALLFFVRHTSQDGLSMLHAQTYVRCDCWVGIITLTTPEAQLRAVRPDYDAFLRGLRVTEA